MHSSVVTSATFAKHVVRASLAGELRLRDVVKSGDFNQFRRAAETPFNVVFEKRR